MIYPKPTTKYHTGSHSTCLSRTGERTRRVKLRKHLSWDKDRLKGKAKTIHTSEAKEGIKSVLPMAGRSSGEQGPMMHNAYLRWQTPSLQASPASFLPLCLHSFTCYVWAIWSGIFLWSLWSAILAVFPPRLVTGRLAEKQKISPVWALPSSSENIPV